MNGAAILAAQEDALAGGERAPLPPPPPPPLDRPVDLELEYDMDDPAAVDIEELFAEPARAAGGYEAAFVDVDLDDEFDLYTVREGGGRKAGNADVHASGAGEEAGERGKGEGEGEGEEGRASAAGAQ
jgi:hypothetical protein